MTGILSAGRPYIPGLDDFRTAEADVHKRNALAQQQRIGILRQQEMERQAQDAQERKGVLNTAAASLPAQDQPMFRLDPGGYMTRRESQLTREDNQRFRAQESQANREARRQELELRLQDSRLNAQERANLQRELQQMQQQGRADLLRLGASLRPPRQEPVPQIVQTENGPMQVGRDGRATPIIGPDNQPVKPKGTERALPTSAAQKLMENQQNLRRAEQALALASGQQTAGVGGVPDAVGDKNATGLKGFLPDAVLQRIDPEGVDTRAAIADLGSLVIHDRSGAAVTAAEFPRLRPFIPQATDDSETVKKKLGRFVTEYRNVVNEASDFYKESGYKVPSETLRSGSDRRQPQDRRQQPREASRRVVVDY